MKATFYLVLSSLVTCFGCAKSPPASQSTATIFHQNKQLIAKAIEEIEDNNFQPPVSATYMDIKTLLLQANPPIDIYIVDRMIFFHVPTMPIDTNRAIIYTHNSDEIKPGLRYGCYHINRVLRINVIDIDIYELRYD